MFREVLKVKFYENSLIFEVRTHTHTHTHTEAHCACSKQFEEMCLFKRFSENFSLVIDYITLIIDYIVIYLKGCDFSIVFLKSLRW